MTESSLRSLLMRSEYEDTWILDAADLEIPGETEPHSETSEPAWVESVVEHFCRSPKCAQIAAMAQHMSKWHAWKGESEFSAMMSTLAAAAPTSPTFTMLIRIMVEHSQG